MLVFVKAAIPLEGVRVSICDHGFGAELILRERGLGQFHPFRASRIAKAA